MDNKRFVGRTKELTELTKRYESGRKEFGVVYGKRRIGKSELISHFLEGKNGILFQTKKLNVIVKPRFAF